MGFFSKLYKPQGEAHLVIEVGARLMTCRDRLIRDIGGRLTIRYFIPFLRLPSQAKLLIDVTSGGEETVTFPVNARAGSWGELALNVPGDNLVVRVYTPFLKREVGVFRWVAIDKTQSIRNLRLQNETTTVAGSTLPIPVSLKTEERDIPVPRIGSVDYIATFAETRDPGLAREIFAMNPVDCLALLCGEGVPPAEIGRIPIHLDEGGRFSVRLRIALPESLMPGNYEIRLVGENVRLATRHLRMVSDEAYSTVRRDHLIAGIALGEVEARFALNLAETGGEMVEPLLENGALTIFPRETLHALTCSLEIPGTEILGIGISELAGVGVLRCVKEDGTRIGQSRLDIRFRAGETLRIGGQIRVHQWEWPGETTECRLEFRINEREIATRRFQIGKRDEVIEQARRILHDALVWEVDWILLPPDSDAPRKLGNVSFTLAGQVQACVKVSSKGKDLNKRIPPWIFRAGLSLPCFCALGEIHREGRAVPHGSSNGHLVFPADYVGQELSFHLAPMELVGVDQSHQLGLVLKVEDFQSQHRVRIYDRGRLSGEVLDTLGQGQNTRIELFVETADGEIVSSHTLAWNDRLAWFRFTLEPGSAWPEDFDERVTVLLVFHSPVHPGLSWAREIILRGKTVTFDSPPFSPGPIVGNRADSRLVFHLRSGPRFLGGIELNTLTPEKIQSEIPQPNLLLRPPGLGQATIRAGERISPTKISQAVPRLTLQWVFRLDRPVVLPLYLVWTSRRQGRLSSTQLLLRLRPGNLWARHTKTIDLPVIMMPATARGQSDEIRLTIFLDAPSPERILAQFAFPVFAEGSLVNPDGTLRNEVIDPVYVDLEFEQILAELEQR